MRFVDAVVKTSAGRWTIEQLTRPGHIRVDARTIAALEAALAREDAPPDDPGRRLVERLTARGQTAPGPFERRDASDLVSVEIEPAGRCNLACGHCFVHFNGARMSDAVFGAALSGAVALGAVELVFNGGEPLLDPACLDRIEAARAAGLRVVLFTNATRLTDTMAGRLAAARVAQVAVSLDGLGATHDALRGARWIRIAPIVPLGRAATRPELAPDDTVLARHADPPACAAHRLDGALPCLAGIDKLFVGARGDVHGCHLFDTSPPLGRLTERSLEDIYHRPDGPQAEVLRHFDEGTLTGCAGCAVLAACHGGCRARAHRMTGSLWGADAVACRGRGVGRGAA